MTSQKLSPTTSLIWCNFFVANIQNNIIGSILEKCFSGTYYYTFSRLVRINNLSEIEVNYEKEFELIMKMVKL